MLNTRRRKKGINFEVGLSYTRYNERLTVASNQGSPKIPLNFMLRNEILSKYSSHLTLIGVVTNDSQFKKTLAVVCKRKLQLILAFIFLIEGGVANTCRQEVQR